MLHTLSTSPWHSDIAGMIRMTAGIEPEWIDTAQRVIADIGIDSWP